MTLRRDLSDLPKPTPVSVEPDPLAPIARTIALTWERNRPPHHVPMASSGEKTPRWRFSDAAICDRSTAYQLYGVEPSDPPTLADIYRMQLGTRIHEEFQHSLHHLQPGDLENLIRVQTEVDSFLLDGEAAGHADVILGFLNEDNGEYRSVAVELKSVNGFGFKKMAGIQNTPEGPRHSHIVQACLAAKANDCDEARVVYLSMELVSPAMATRYNLDDVRRFCAEWVFDRDQIEAYASSEIERVSSLLAAVDAGEDVGRRIPSPEIPTGAVVVDPGTGRWELHSPDGQKVMGAGRTWHCDYCRFQRRCQADL